MASRHSGRVYDSSSKKRKCVLLNIFTKVELFHQVEGGVIQGEGKTRCVLNRQVDL